MNDNTLFSFFKNTKNLFLMACCFCLPYITCAYQTSYPFNLKISNLSPYDYTLSLSDKLLNCWYPEDQSDVKVLANSTAILKSSFSFDNMGMCNSPSLYFELENSQNGKKSSFSLSGTEQYNIYYFIFSDNLNRNIINIEPFVNSPYSLPYVYNEANLYIDSHGNYFIGQEEQKVDEFPIYVEDWQVNKSPKIAIQNTSSSQLVLASIDRICPIALGTALAPCVELVDPKIIGKSINPSATLDIDFKVNVISTHTEMGPPDYPLYNAYLQYPPITITLKDPVRHTTCKLTAESNITSSDDTTSSDKYFRIPFTAHYSVFWP